MFVKFFQICAVCLAAILLSCSDGSTDPSAKKGEVSAKIREDIVLEFNSSSTQLENNSLGQTVTRTMTAEMTISGIETHRMTITVIDDGSNSSSFNVEDGEAIVAYENVGRADYTFNSEAKGVITLTTLTDKQWVGSFYFEVKNQTGDKEIFLYSGTINVSK